MIDGVHIGEHCMVVALGIGAVGTKTPLALWEGVTENTAVVKSLADLVDRGLSAEHGLLAVVDGRKALTAGLRRVFGNKVLIQNCQIHKRRYVIDHLPEVERAWVDTKLAGIFADDNNPDRAEAAARALAKALEKKRPGAAASLREGLEQMFTVARLGITGTLAKTLTSSNPIESMFSIARTVNRNVTRWRDGQMVMRWTAAGMKQAAAQFRRVKGFAQMPALIAALEETTQTADTKQPVKHPKAA